MIIICRCLVLDILFSLFLPTCQCLIFSIKIFKSFIYFFKTVIADMYSFSHPLYWVWICVACFSCSWYHDFYGTMFFSFVKSIVLKINKFDHSQESNSLFFSIELYLFLPVAWEGCYLEPLQTKLHLPLSFPAQVIQTI